MENYPVREELYRFFLLFAYWVICMLFYRLMIFFKINFFEIFFQNTIRVSNSLDPDQTQHFVGPDLGLNCLQGLSAEDTRRQS